MRYIFVWNKKVDTNVNFVISNNYKIEKLVQENNIVSKSDI